MARLKADTDHDLSVSGPDLELVDQRGFANGVVHLRDRPL